jgi:alkanesulfonate monooxygenase SsuD/methylene tetrahydromethanopterin reductase-like flavin-dependent oxidoreductase (luciferase family)
VATPHERLRDIVRFGEITEQAGLDAYGVGEHHSHAFAVSSPAVALAAVGERTRRIRLLSTVTVLTTLDPVRVYEDYATLDLLSDGRAEVVAGRSAFAEPLALFGVDAGQVDDVFAEKLDLLLRIRDEPTVSWSGQVRPELRRAQVAPRSLASPLPVWVGVGGTPSSAVRAGLLGLPLMIAHIGGDIEHPRRLAEIYRRAGQSAGHPGSRLRVGVSTHLYVGEESSRARSDFFPYYRHYLRGVGRGWDITREQLDASSAPGGALLIGSPDEVAGKLAALGKVVGADLVLGQVDVGGIPREMVESSIFLFGRVAKPTALAQLSAGEGP